MNKRIILILKILLMAAVVGFLGWEFRKAWLKAGNESLPIDWRFGGIAMLGFACSMLTSAMVWRWLTWKMKDRSPTIPILGAYAFSQMGKYFPGKIALLLMRIERAGRFGMAPSVCTLSTILENALYMISGGLVGMLAILRISKDLEAGQRVFVWSLTVAGVAVLATACHPGVFYGVVNRFLRTMKKPEVPVSRRLRARYLMLAVIGFVPCWLFGGLALWAAARCVYPLPLIESEWFAGAYALSVIIGMASFLPGGFGIREGVVVVVLTAQFGGQMDQHRALLLAGVGAGLLRMFQIVVELVLGGVGVTLTALPEGKKAEGGT